MPSWPLDILAASWAMLREAAPYMLFGLLVAGVLKVLLPASTVARHLGRGRFLPVFKAALFGIPLPLCSCGVLPAAQSLRRRGANRGATSAFLISTPETGVDSIAITYALMDPLMTVARPLAAFAAAVAAGLAQNVLGSRSGDTDEDDAPRAGADQAPPRSGTWLGKGREAVRYAMGELWDDIAGWFVLGLLVAGVITALLPGDLMTRHLGGGLAPMLLMAVVGVPLYICATASTPIAASLVLKGLSPGAALVFLLVGPATNAAALTVLLKVLGRRGVAIYLAAIILVGLSAGLLLDQLYLGLGLTASAAVGKAAEVIPAWVEVAGAVALAGLSFRTLARWLAARRAQGASRPAADPDGPRQPVAASAAPS